MHPLMRAFGHELVTPTLTGLGDRSHLAAPHIDLDLHIRDVIETIEHEALRDFILLGHSYGGMVATGVANRMADRVAELVYLDAFVPRDGQSVFDLLPPAMAEKMRQRCRDEGQGWLIPSNPLPPDTSEEDRQWILPRRGMQPLGTHEQPIKLDADAQPLPRSYIYCTHAGPGDVFAPFAAQASSEPGWRYFEMEASHSPHITEPEALAHVLARIAGD